MRSKRKGKCVLRKSGGRYTGRRESCVVLVGVGGRADV